MVNGLFSFFLHQFSQVHFFFRHFTPWSQKDALWWLWKQQRPRKLFTQKTKDPGNVRFCWPVSCVFLLPKKRIIFLNSTDGPEITRNFILDSTNHWEKNCVIWSLCQFKVCKCNSLKFELGSSVTNSWLYRPTLQK